MEIKELNKKQYILLTLLITFVVSIATGIVTVSLMNQMPKTVPQTINNVIQRTIEKVTTVEVPIGDDNESDQQKTDKKENSLFTSSNNEALVSIYLKSQDVVNTENSLSPSGENNTDQQDASIETEDKTSAIGQGVIISDVGLILVESSIVLDGQSYKTILDDKDFDLSILKKFNNGFSVMKISVPENNSQEENKTEI